MIVDDAEAAYARETAWIARCVSTGVLRERLAVYEQDLRRARDNEWSGNAILADALMQAATRRLEAIARLGTAVAPRNTGREAECGPSVAFAVAPQRVAPHVTRDAGRPSLHELAIEGSLRTERTAAVSIALSPNEFRAVRAQPPVFRRLPPTGRGQTEELPNVPTANSRATNLTGRDLAEFRSTRGLTFRQAAELLGTPHGTLAKAEGDPDRLLGPKLGDSLATLTKH